MKRLIILFMFLMSVTKMTSQWDIIQMNSGEYIFDMEQLTPTRFIFSEAFKLYEYNIETEQLQTYTDPNFQNITRISFVDSMLGYALKVPSGILRTIDGGITWTLINMNVNAHYGFNSFIFLDSLTGFCAKESSGSVALKTIDGGIIWDTLKYNGQVLSMRKIKSFQYGSTNYLLGISGALFLKSTDIGVSWEIDTISPNTYGTYSSLEADNNNVNVLYACGQGFNGSNNIGLIAKSVDFGQNWEVKEFPWIYRFKDIEMVNELIGYAVGKSQGQINCIYKTIDGGESWHPQNFSTPPAFSPELLNIHCINEDTCFASGNPGTILMTTNGGGTFADLSVSDINVSTSQIYPNPFENTITIQSERRIKTLTIFDELGRILYINNNPTSNSVTVDTKSFSSGIYIVKLETENNSETLKIVKK